MSETQEEAQKEVQRLQRRFGVSREQAAQLYQESLRMSQAQLQRGLQATSNFVSTVVALLSSAVGFVAAFAWNTAIQQALSEYFGSNSKIDKALLDLYYALVTTIFAVVVIAVLGVINGRIKGRSLLPTNPL